MAVSMRKLFKFTCTAVSLSWLGSQGLLLYHLKFAKPIDPFSKVSKEAIPLSVRDSRKGLVAAVISLYELDYGKDKINFFENNAIFEDPAVFLDGRDAVASGFSKMPSLFSKSESLKREVIHGEKMVLIDQVQRYTLPGKVTIDIPSMIYLHLKGNQGNEKIVRMVEEWFSVPLIGDEAPYVANIGYIARQFRKLHGLPFKYF